MLNTDLIKEEIQLRGLSFSHVASRCGVTPEAVSLWMDCKEVPRPSKLKMLAELLGIPVGTLFLPQACPCGTAAVVGPLAITPTPADVEAWADMGWRMSELELRVRSGPLSAPRAWANSSCDRQYLEAMVAHLKRSLKIAPGATIHARDLILLNQEAGTFLLPTPWLGDREGQRHTLHFEAPTQKSLWLVFGLNTLVTEFEASLAHVLGLQYSKNSLKGSEREQFANEFSKVLRSHVTVLDEDPGQTVGAAYFSGPSPSVSEYLSVCESVFGTPVFRAISAYQRQQGGRDPAFISALLNIDVVPAFLLSHALAGTGTEL